MPAGAALVCGDVRDEAALAHTLRQARAEAVVHMAALAEVAESVAQPQRYQDVNVAGTAAVIAAARAADVRRLVFSSSAAVYGEPGRVPIDEQDALAPTNPYGQTKLDGERLLESARERGFLAFTALRYFNACGADGEPWRRPRPRDAPRTAGAARRARRHGAHGVRRRLPDRGRHLRARLRARGGPG